MNVLSRRPVMIAVRIFGDPPEFELISKKGGVPIKKGGHGNDDEVTFDNWQGGKWQDGFEIEFIIQDDTGKGYRFFQDLKKPQLDDAMAVKIVNQIGHCPKAGMTRAEFQPTALSQNRKTLTVTNPNGHKQYFGFAFFFGFPGDLKYRLKYDPIGDNRNGPAPRVWK